LRLDAAALSGAKRGLPG